jgi:hypothetical protein
MCTVRRKLKTKATEDPTVNKVTKGGHDRVPASYRRRNCPVGISHSLASSVWRVCSQWMHKSNLDVGIDSLAFG